MLNMVSHAPPFGARSSCREGCAGVFGADRITSCATAPSLPACPPLLSGNACRGHGTSLEAQVRFIS